MLSRLRPALAALVIALLLPVAASAPALADETAGPTPRSAPTVRHTSHLTPHQTYLHHLHALHVLHLRRLAALRRVRQAASRSHTRHALPHRVHHVVARRVARTSGIRARILGVAQSYLGVPYRHAGASRAGVDCSGLTQAVYEAAGVGIPRTVYAQRQAARYVTGHAQVGDLLFYGTYHVAIVAAVRNGRVIDTIVARHSGTLVQHQAPYESYTVGAVV